MNEGLVALYSTADLKQSLLILKELSYMDEDGAVLFRFGFQKAFQSACLLGADRLIRIMVSSLEKHSLFISHDFLSELMRLKLTTMLLLLLDHSDAFELKGEDIDPDGICGTLLKQDQYNQPF